MANEFDNEEFTLYGKMARVASKWELSHDRLDNGMTLNHIPFGTAQASTIIKTLRYIASDMGYKIRVTWLDAWNVKIVWYK
jgi:hypothetical protein